MTEKVWEVLKQKRERLAQLEAEEAARQKERKSGAVGVKALSVLMVGIFLMSGLAQAVLGITWLFIEDDDGLTPGLRWSYTRMQRPSNIDGFGGPEDNALTFAAYWEWQTNQLWGIYGSGGSPTYDTIAADVANEDQTLWPANRQGACLTWDGNMPGYWPDTGNVRPNLVLAGGLDSLGHAMAEVNVFSFTSYYPLEGEWVAKKLLDVPVAYPSCGRITMRATWASNGGFDILGAVILGGLTGVPLAATNAAQILRSEWFIPPSGWYTNFDYAPSMGARFGAAMIDASQWGLHGENLDWFLWSGGATFDGLDAGGEPIAATMVYPSTVHCYFEQLFGWITCEDYTNIGPIAPDASLAASSFVLHESGKPMMMLYGGSGEFGFPRADVYTVRFSDTGSEADTATWTWLPPDNAPPPARAGSILFCSEMSWIYCQFAESPLPRYYISGGQRWGSLNSDVAEVWVPERHP